MQKKKGRGRDGFREKKDLKQATCDSSFFVFPEKA